MSAGQPAPVTGELAAPSVVWGRVQRLILDADAPPPSELPEETTVEWARAIVTEAFAQARVDGEAPGAHAFVQEWLVPKVSSEDDPAELARNWGVPLLQQIPALEVLLLSPVAEHRVGVFSEQAYLVRRSDSGGRGAGISSLVFGRPPPPPPLNEPVPTPNDGQTRRQEVEATLTSVSCQACHALFQPLGFAYGHFDELGEYIELDDGLPIDTSGTYMIDLVERSFADMPELAPYMVDSCDAKLGLADSFLQAALRIEGYAPEDRQGIFELNAERMRQAFVNSTYRSYEDLVQAFAQTPAVLKP